MRPEVNPLSPPTLLVSWLAAAASLPAALAVAVFGQALGAMVGGCSWIGVALPLGRPVWALVNEPSLHFASLGAASGYWLGSTALSLIAALATIPVTPRPRTVAAEIAVLQFAWANATVGLAWLPLLDRDDGHLARWLDLHHLPGHLLWLAPALSVPAAVIIAVRLLSLTRAAHQYVGPFTRLLTVALHLLPLPILCIATASAATGALPTMATVALAAPIVAVLGVAVRGLPSPYVHTLQPVRVSAVALLTLALLAGATLIGFAGRPLPDHRVAGLLWSEAFASNNIRPWIDTGANRQKEQPGSGQERPSSPE
ncbi:MAG: hypothetical protein LJE95_02730 [Acidobacteria bacterium]|jgi:hypothetical protein|nr:hypothetical protein [Acidobacteriota bacterium]